MKSRWLCVALLAFAVGFAGCGGKDKDKSAKDNEKDKTAQADADKSKADPNKAQTGDKDKAATTTPASDPTLPKPGTTTVAPVATPAAGAFDSAYITEDFIGAVIIRPKQLLGSPILSSLPQDQILQEALPPGADVDPRTIEQITILMAPFPAGAAEQLFAPPVPRTFPPGFEDEEMEGHTFPGDDAGKEEFPFEETKPESVPADEAPVESDEAELPPSNLDDLFEGLEPANGESAPEDQLEDAGVDSPEAAVTDDEPASDTPPGLDDQPGFSEGPDFGNGPTEFESPEFGGPTNFGFIVRFTDAAAAAGMIGEITKTGTAVMYENLTYYKEEFSPVCAFLPDDHTIVGAPEELLKKMITSKGAKSPLLDRLAQADGKADLVAIVMVEPLREIANKAAKTMLEQAGDQLPPGTDQFAAMIDHLKAATLSFTLGGDPLLNLTLEGENAQSTAQLKSSADSAISLAKGLYAVARIAMSKEAPPEAQPVLKIADELVAGITVTEAPDRVSVSVKRPANFDELPKLLEPVIKVMEAASAKAQQLNNLKQIGLAIHNYHDVYNKLPNDIEAEDGGAALLSWRVAILPFLEAAYLYDEFQQDESWDGENNQRLLDEMPFAYGAEGNKSSILRFVGPGTPYPDGAQKPLMLNGITDGTSNTLMLVEVASDKAVPWTQPADIQFDPENPLAGLGEIPEEGFRALFFDGSVRVLPKNIDPETMRRLVDPQDGEIIELDF